MRIGVLGPLEIDEGRARLGARDRVVLSALAMNPGRLLTPEQLADAVWADSPPATWSKSLQGCISRLRKLLGPDAIDVHPRLLPPHTARGSRRGRVRPCSAAGRETVGPARAHRGARLAAVTERVTSANPQLSVLEQEFLGASGALAATEERTAREQVFRQKQTNRRLRSLAGALAVLLVVALGAGGLAGFNATSRRTAGT